MHHMCPDNYSYHNAYFNNNGQGQEVPLTFEIGVAGSEIIQI